MDRAHVGRFRRPSRLLVPSSQAGPPTWLHFWLQLAVFRTRAPRFVLVRSGTSSALRNSGEPPRTRSSRPGSGGQGYESPQLHPDGQAVLLQEGGLSRSWCHRVGHWSAVEEGAEAGGGVLTAVGKELGSEVGPTGGDWSGGPVGIGQLGAARWAWAGRDGRPQRHGFLVIPQRGR